MDYSSYSSSYSESGLWNKIKKCAKKAGRTLVKNALILYYAFPNASIEDKTIIVGALGYFISPIDAIPDTLPGGFSDDAYVLFKAVKALSRSISPSVLAKAEQKTNEWLG